MMLFDLRFTGIAGLGRPIANKLTIPAWLRGYAYAFAELFAPTLTKAVVNAALTSRSY